jgi:hypothetical protein
MIDWFIVVKCQMKQYINVKEMRRGNQECKMQRNLATLGLQDTGRRQRKQKNTRQKAKKMSNTDPTKNRVLTQASSDGQAAPDSHKTPAMLLLQQICVGYHYAQKNTNNLNKR